MTATQQKRGWVLLAVLAIGVALLLLLIPNPHNGNPGAFLALVPLLLVGILSPLSLLSPLAFIYLGRTPDAPALPFAFQRPPPLPCA
jgi:hypothetical protein